MSVSVSPSVLEALESAIGKTSALLCRQQDPDGFWVGELQADTTLESDTIKLRHLLDRVDRRKQEKLVWTILKNELPDGGWPIYAGGPPEINATVKAYAALKLAGTPDDDPVLKRNRQVILRLGGLERINSFEKTYLALLGAYPWSQVPVLPPELIFLPSWFYFNIYEVSYWSRTILIPLAVMHATKPCSPSARLCLDELWVNPRLKRATITNFQKGGAFWRVFFLFANRILRIHESLPFKPLRAKALRACDRWINERLVETDGLGAIFPAMMNAIFALKGLGYRDGDPLYEKQIKEMERLEVPDEELGLKIQPCFSPVWDTALAMYALGRTKAASVAGPLRRAVDWLLAREIRQWGDWVVKNPRAKPGGWAFEFKNPFYPDVDDTAQVLLGLHEVYPVGRQPQDVRGAFERGLEWILSMQNRDGGWSSFDKNNNCLPLTHFPFADHNAMLDPSACDITGRILELLSAIGVPKTHPAVQRARAFLLERQEVDGSWFGRWGVNYIYGTWLALRGLRAVGEPMDSFRYQRAGRWLISRQNPDGGWGESCRSYDDPGVKGQGPSTPSQTSWALMALMSCGLVAEPSFQRGLEYLLNHQKPDGDWQEEWFTGTGFPRVFYLRYHMYRIYFPLLALTEARDILKRTEG
ncbi:MAG: squalene--hopene cyclase [Candidatus Omnitrophica bacterium]|nr:squalene--hopene cyclase [Candidatus Omnitrophota bacterium]